MNPCTCYCLRAFQARPFSLLGIAPNAWILYMKTSLKVYSFYKKIDFNFQIILIQSIKKLTFRSIVISKWSKRRESDPHINLGKVTFYHWTTPATYCARILYYIDNYIARVFWKKLKIILFWRYLSFYYKKIVNMIIFEYFYLT